MKFLLCFFNIAEYDISFIINSFQLMFCSC